MKLRFSLMNNVMKKGNGWFCAVSSYNQAREQTEVRAKQEERQQSVFRSSLITKAPTWTGAPDTVNTAVLFSEH